MSRMNRTNKKNVLLLHKEKLLEELKNCERQIEEAKQNQTNNNLKYDDNSDSDFELSPRMHKGPSLPSLVRKKSALQTRCNATAELTGLEVLESTVNILPQDPDLSGEPSIAEDGVWREVIAECKVDLIPFTISFYVHQPHRSFGQPSYRCLRVVASKQANEQELSNSVLSKMITPSNAFEVLKSYAAAYRSRRTTLARLAETYGDDLFMTPLSEGGYQLQCANVLELSWTLESKPSTVAFFRHRMKLSLEYMDESYLKIITQANKEMSHPSIDTEERTLLLSKIISTCLKAQGEGAEAAGSETSRVQKRANDEALDFPLSKKRKENEVMGPPKALPKKSKVKDKENAESRLTNKNIKEVNKDINNAKKNVPNKEPNENTVDRVNKAKVPDLNKVSSKNTNTTEKAKNNANKVNKAQTKVVESNKENSKNTKNTNNAKNQPINDKNPTKESNKKSDKKTNNAPNSQNANKLNKVSSKVPDLTEVNSNHVNNKGQKTNKINTAPSKENVEKTKNSKHDEKLAKITEKTLEKGKNKVPNKNVINKEKIVITKENSKKLSQETNKQKFTNSNEKTFPQIKRINLKPNIVRSKNDRINKNAIEKSGNTEYAIDSMIKPINKRFSNGNINKGKINLQKTKIPQTTSAEKMKLFQFRTSPRTNVTKATASETRIQTLGDVKRTSSSNIARLVKKPSGKPKLM